MHEAALYVLEITGVRVRLPDDRDHFTRGGAILKDDTMIYIGRDRVEAALASAPKPFRAHGAVPARDVILEPGSMVFQPGAGAPRTTDLTRGRRPGTASDFRNLTRLTQRVDVLQILLPPIEPQDVPTNARHYMTMEVQLTLCDKLPLIFSCGTPQVDQSFEILSDFRILLTQLVRPGAQVPYGTFTSSVDMKSGAPAFGTPEHFSTSPAAGQMARLFELPWRSAAGYAADTSDVQAAGETPFGPWDCLMAGATVTIHAAVRLEEGLTVSYEKQITDIEILQMVADHRAETPATDALTEIAPAATSSPPSKPNRAIRPSFANTSPPIGRSLARGPKMAVSTSQPAPPPSGFTSRTRNKAPKSTPIAKSPSMTTLPTTPPKAARNGRAR